jgi:hypothetical protein
VVTCVAGDRGHERREEREEGDLSLHMRESSGHDLQDAVRGRVGEENHLREEKQRSEMLPPAG